jgi:hypothetical protein
VVFVIYPGDGWQMMVCEPDELPEGRSSRASRSSSVRDAESPVGCPLSLSDLTSRSRKEMKAVRKAPVSFPVNHHDRQVVRRLQEPPR